MEWNPKTLQFLSQSFVDTLSLQPEPRRHAEKNLSDAADTPNYGLAVLRFLDEPSVDEQIRECAAVNLKNHLKTRWAPSSATPIPDTEKKEIMTRIVPLTLSATPRIQAHLNEALAAIGNHDFPMLWSVLLPQLKSSTVETAINADDFASVIYGIIDVVNFLFKKFRCQFESYPNLLDLKHYLENCSALLLSAVERISRSKIYPYAADRDLLIEAQRICFRISCSLHFLDLPAFFEANSDELIINDFNNYLTVTYPAIESESDGTVASHRSLIDVCKAIDRYMKKWKELFRKYLKEFVEAVCSLLVVSSASPSCQQLTMTAIRFLTIISTNVRHELFSGDEILQKITESIVIPNVMLTIEDEDLFETNYVEFIRRDIEGSDHLTTRRRVACELLRSIAGNYKGKIFNKVSTQINNCLDQFAKNPAANWKYKHCAIYLILSLTTQKACGASISTDLLDVDSFFKSVIVPELHGQDVNASPIVKAGALKLFTMFRVLIPKQYAMALLGDVVRFVGSDCNVVHSYAATCIEKLLQAKYTSTDIGPILPDLVTNLFGALDKSNSEENEYIMRCIMRVFQITDISSSEMASLCITKLTAVLERTKKNPVFNHCLFEAIAALVKRACEKNASLVPAFEKWLLDSLGFDIFLQDKTDLFPYAFQLLAQLVDLQKCPVLPANVMHLFDFLIIKPYLWKQSANVPALVCLFQSFIQQSPNVVKTDGRLKFMVGKFEELVSSPSTEEYGFQILYAMIENLAYDDMAKHMNGIWATLGTRLEDSKTERLVRCVIIFMCLFLVKHGNRKLADLINFATCDISFLGFLNEFWIPYLTTIRGSTEVKLCAVASTKLLCEPPSLVEQTGPDLWGKLLDGIVTLLSLPKEERVEDESEATTTDCYQATFVRLHNVGNEKKDYLKEIEDPKYYSVKLVANFSTYIRRRFPSTIKKYLPPLNQALLLHLCASYNLAIV